MRRLLILGAALPLALAGCQRPGKSAPGEAAVCPPIKAYTAEQETALAAAVQTLPDASPLIWAVRDYGALRAAVRACAAHP